MPGQRRGTSAKRRALPSPMRSERVGDKRELSEDVSNSRPANATRTKLSDEPVAAQEVHSTARQQGGSKSARDNREKEDDSNATPRRSAEVEAGLKERLRRWVIAEGNRPGVIENPQFLDLVLYSASGAGISVEDLPRVKASVALAQLRGQL
ncbi:hypothetical protein FA95DRAFT_1604636 [Auriscalpium vulgare]|uniref:Uncharacterized protein n=1 Tax=Auriscalpium vulgare TaxID=40419 RepID=A0ACB8RZW4_9AGAM|nr:hypothetical protein FA95DRAFT_1604636 [Auriscalpium vulgare]